MSNQRPGYKREFCDALPVRMRLAGWPEDCCANAGSYVHAVADVYTGNAWRNYARDVDIWLLVTTQRHMTGLRQPLPYRLPLRSGVVWAPTLLKQKEPS